VCPDRRRLALGRLRAALPWIRWLPFAYVVCSSVWVTSRAPRGRKPFTFDVDMSVEAMGRALTKVPHMTSSAIVFLIALLATGTRRIWLAVGLSLMVGLIWELAQTTVVGHNARLADLLPDMVGVLPLAAAVALLRALWLRRRPPPPR
jgi:VanZ family protein